MTLQEESELFRDEIAEILNLDWKERGRGGIGTAARRQILSAFLYEAYSGLIPLKQIGTLCGYVSRGRHTMILHNVRVVNDALSVRDKTVTPLYLQAKTVFRAFKFNEYEPIKKERYRQFSIQIPVEQFKKLSSEAVDRDVSLSGVIRNSLDQYFAK